MSKLGDLIQLQDYFTEIQQETVPKITMWITNCNFTDDEQLFLAEEISYIASIRPTSLDLLANVMCNVLQNSNFQYFHEVFIQKLIENKQFIFLRKLLITGAIGFNEFEDRIINEDKLFFAPECSLFDDYTEFEEQFEMGFSMDSLGFAIKYDNDVRMEEIVKDDINIDVEWCPFEPYQKPFKHTNPLEASALFGSKNCFSTLLKKGAQITDNVAQCAIIGGDKHIISQVDVSKHLDLALKYRRGDLLPNYSNLTFLDSIKYRHYSAAAMSFQDDPNKEDEEGYTALHYSVIQNCIPFVSFLISNECDVNIQTKKEQKTALHFAVCNKNLTIIKLLLDNSAIEKQDVNGDTPLHIAVRQNNVEEVKLLIQKGMNPKTKNLLGLSPLSIAKDNRNFEIYGLLSIDD